MSLKVDIEEKVITQDITQVIKESIICYGDRYEKPQPLIKYVNRAQEYTYINRGGLSGVFGKQKSRKTFYLSLLMAAAVGNTVIDDKLRGYSHGLNHLWFDTEQTKYYTSMIPYRVVKKLNLKHHPENFKMYSIKKYSTEDRIKIIQHEIENTHNPGLVIIDGVRDIIKNFNHLEEVTELINNLMRWSDTTNAHICLALHINPLKKGEDEKPRGHLGTEIQNKVEASVVIEKRKEDPSMSIVSPRDFRDLDINKFGLRVGDKAIPYLTDYADPDGFGF